MPPRKSFELFSIPGGVSGDPLKLDPAAFATLGALEVQHIERWIRTDPSLLGEELKIVSNQFAGFTGSKDRLDLLAIDRDAQLVVIEIKRDTSGAYQDLQALRYAAMASTMQVKDVVEAYAEYVKKTEDRELSRDVAADELQQFAGADLTAIDESEQPRLILVAGAFESAVTMTVLWLRQSAGLDIRCVQLVPFEVAGELVIGSSILIPLPEAEPYMNKVAEKQHVATANKTKLDHEAAKAFIASVPTGRWTAYGDVAAAGGSPKGAMGVAAWLTSTKTQDVPHVYRVLNAIGEVNEGWKPTSEELPSTAAEVRELLAREGVAFGADQRAALSQRWTVSDYKRAIEAEPDLS